MAVFQRAVNTLKPETLENPKKMYKNVSTAICAF